MPGKVNPVICEAVIQVGAQVMGNHVGDHGRRAVGPARPQHHAADDGAQPAREHSAAGERLARVFADKALAGLVANARDVRGYVEISPSMATALNPLIGYDKAAEIAKRSSRSGRPVRELAYEESGLTREQIEEALDPRRQTEAGGTGASGG